MKMPRIPTVTVAHAFNGDAVCIAITGAPDHDIDYAHEADLIAETLDDALPLGTWQALMGAMQRRNNTVDMPARQDVAP